ncbi:MAG: hypothetical protein HY895_01780 [Deltaproteobacteria bacterium]|nr:hypothetical protein [Deltaproteobacteria bacterium]
MNLNRTFIVTFAAVSIFELDLPAAPAVMVGDEIVIEGSNVAEEKVEGVIRRHLGLPEAEPGTKGLFSRLLGN